jgi:asparaginyl-tRNA synthetase
MRIRNAAFMALHNFFQQEDFCHVHTPIVTPLDCEGAGELFRIRANRAETPDDEDFFGRPCFLTVSGQLYAEMCAASLRNVYTFGPTFRAEASNTSYHLAEFWMLEPEMAFTDISGDMDVCEAMLRHATAEVLKQCPDEIDFFSKRGQEPAEGSASEGGEATAATSDRTPLRSRLEALVATDFARVTYTDALEILANSGKDFVFGVPAWGDDLNREHEMYLAEVVYQRPVFVTHYPLTLKPFYMRASELAEGADPSRRTVECMDLLVGGVGELVGGSQREERLPELKAAMKEAKLRTSHYQWYLDLRKYGTVPHAGFGLGFERYLKMLTDLENVRDVVMVPRAAGVAQF